MNSEGFELLKNVKICGVMGMATFTENEDIIRSEFKELVYIFNELKIAISLVMILRRFLWECRAIIRLQLKRELQWYELEVCYLEHEIIRSR